MSAFADADTGSPVRVCPPYVSSDWPELPLAFGAAMGDLAGNIRPEQHGLSSRPDPILHAGLFYELWTRDSSIQSWNYFALIDPAVNRNSLLACLVQREGEGLPRVGGEYWDRIIWIVGAWHHWLATGDDEFLAFAHAVGVAEFLRQEADEFDAEDGLFCGGACYGDGVSAYPDRYATPSGAISEWAKLHPGEARACGGGLPMKVLSTNCLYLESLRLLQRMEIALQGAADPAWNAKAEKLHQSILAAFWDNRRGRFRYLVDAVSGCEGQEGLGIAFAILCGVAGPYEITRMFRSVEISPHGIACLTPEYARYQVADRLQRGRHCGLIWPHINTFWAQACAAADRLDGFLQEFAFLTAKVVRDGHFAEIYDRESGLRYGGVQEFVLGPKEWWHDLFLKGNAGVTPQGNALVEWTSGPRQSWCATGWFKVLVSSIMGLNITPEGVCFQPHNITPARRIAVEGLVLRGRKLRIEMEGQGSAIKGLMLNGVAVDPALVRWADLPADGLHFSVQLE